ncbi:MAG: GIY-YIG nuclease family protein [Nitrosomonas sp.]|nr:GIY-YIG nuclease family protein [Nitrosomonas sp.]
MDKEEILIELKRLAEAAGGKAPGFQRFSSETGLRKSDWYPHYWLRWGDAICEAGLQANEFNSATDTDFLILKYIELIRELGHFPIEGELRVKAKKDKGFPSHSGFTRLGSKYERVRKIIEYCGDKEGYEDILVCCDKVTLPKDHEPESIGPEMGNVGYVYLVRHGSRNEYKIGRTNNPLRREGEIRLELPEKIKPVHYIETDDPAGIERYWHSRFANKRKEGEWFSLTLTDVLAFKRWRKIY